VLQQLERRVPLDLHQTQALALGLAETPVFVVPILAQGRLAGAVALLDATAASNPTRDSLLTLASQVGLALESAALTESMMRIRARRV